MATAAARSRLVRLPEPPLPRSSRRRSSGSTSRRTGQRASSPSRSGVARRRRGVVARPGARTARGARSSAAAVVAVATTHVAYSRMAVTDVLLTLGVTVAPRAARHGPARVGRASRSVSPRRRSTPARSSLVPLVVAGVGEVAALGRAAALAVGGVRADEPVRRSSTPATRGTTSRASSARAGRLARVRGRPGRRRSPSLDRLWETRRPGRARGASSALVVAAGAEHARRDLVLLSFVAVYALSLLHARARTSTATCCRSCPCSPCSRRASPPLAVATLVAALVPLWWSVGDARR